MVEARCPLCGEYMSACTCGGALLPHEGNDLPGWARSHQRRRRSQGGVSWQLVVSLALPPGLLLLLCGLPLLAMTAAAIALVAGCALYWRSPEGSERGRRGYAIVAAAFVLVTLAVWLMTARTGGWTWPHGWPTWLGPPSGGGP